MFCISIHNTDLQSAINMSKHFHMCELRLDMLDFSDIEVQEFLSVNENCIVTFRSFADDVERLKRLDSAARYGARYIDIDMRNNKDFHIEIDKIIENTSALKIVSHHDFAQTPKLEDLRALLDEMEMYAPHIRKIACLSNSLMDNERMLSLYRQYENLIAFCMGESGVTTRVESLFKGAKFTYVSGENGSSAPGQIDIIEYRELIQKYLKDQCRIQKKTYYKYNPRQK